MHALTSNAKPGLSAKRGYRLFFIMKRLPHRALCTVILLSTLCNCTLSPTSRAPGTTLDGPSASTVGHPAPEIEETTLTKAPKTTEKPPTRNIDIAQPPLISEDTVDCALSLLIDKGCGGFSVDDSSD